MSCCGGKKGSLEWEWNFAEVHLLKCTQSHRWIGKRVAVAFCASLYISSTSSCCPLKRAAPLSEQIIMSETTYSFLFFEAFLYLQKNDVVQLFENFVFVYRQFVVELLNVNFLLDVFWSSRSNTRTCARNLPLYVPRDIHTWVKSEGGRLYPVGLVWYIRFLMAVFPILQSFLHRVEKTGLGRLVINSSSYFTLGRYFLARHDCYFHWNKIDNGNC